MTTKHPESESSKPRPATGQATPGWLKLTAIAAASALVGGFAAAWWHRKTLAKLRQEGEKRPNPHFGISETESSDEP